MQLHADELCSRVEPLFKENFEKFGEFGAAVSIWQNGKLILDLCGGFRDKRREQPWTDDTLVLIWSATKGIGSACLLHVLQEHQPSGGYGSAGKIDIGRRVGEFWPEFAQAGKETITLAQLLSHQAGLAALDREVDILDYESVIDALERQEPNWPPGTAHGYHARTFGFLVDEIVRRISGMRISQYWRKVFAEPLDLDLWIGLPEKENARVATMVPPKAGKVPEPKQFYQDVATRGTFAHKVFTSPRGLTAVSEMNKPEIRAESIVSLGGIGSANSLAKFYAMLANDGSAPDGRVFFSEQTMSLMKATLTNGIDRVFQIPTAFSAGFMKDSNVSLTAWSGRTSKRRFGKSMSAFGQPGAGGSNGFADPENKIGFAYVMNQMEPSVLPNEKSLRLVDAMYQERD
ncbi:MAG TPA: serine hydrolase domain-containing protein [Chthoniobacterales bacterium]